MTRAQYRIMGGLHAAWLRASKKEKRIGRLNEKDPANQNLWNEWLRAQGHLAGLTVGLSALELFANAERRIDGKDHLARAKALFAQGRKPKRRIK